MPRSTRDSRRRLSCANRFSALISREPLCARSATRSARAGIAISAAAVGVGARRSDTKSINVVSVSCPTAEISGIRHAAAARMTISSLKAIRSSRLPPPRATISTSGRGIDPPAGIASKPAMAAAMRSAAPSPCTGTGHTRIVRGNRRAIVILISWITAPRSLVTTPITLGNPGSVRLRPASNRPSAASRWRIISIRASSAPTPAYSIRSMINW